MLTYDPIPWLMAQEGMPVVRARRLLNLDREGDEKVVRAIERRLAGNQLGDGSFEQSPMKTAGVLNLLDDLKPTSTMHWQFLRHVSGRTVRLAIHI